MTIIWSWGGGACCDNQIEWGGGGRIVTIRWSGEEGEACCDNQTKCVYGGGVVL